MKLEFQRKLRAIFAEFDLGKIDLKLDQPSIQHRVSWDNASNEAKLNFKNAFEEKLHLIKHEHGC